jgi:hypothetical protein
MKQIAAFRLAMIGATMLAATTAHAQSAGAQPQVPMSWSMWQQLQNNPAGLSQLGAGLPPVAAEPGPIPAPPAPGQAPVVPSWSILTNIPLGGPYNFGNPLLLTDGAVIVHRTDNPSWWKLTPDINGSYINGTWSQIASLPVINGTQYAPKFLASAVLPDGRVIIEGGEYNNAAEVRTNLGAIYDPIANTWTSVGPPSGWARIGDAQSVVLANGTFMLADCCDSGNKSALLNATTLTWTATGTGKFDLPDEEAWALLSSGKVLTVDAYVLSGTCGQNTEIYDPNTGAWTSAGNVPSILPDCNTSNGNQASFELGPNVLTYAGTVLAFGGTTSTTVASHMAIYSTGGTWSAGADQPPSCGTGTQACTMADAPAAVLPSGNVLLAASAGLFTGPTNFFEYSPSGNVYNPVTGTSDAGITTSFYHNFLVLPTGQILNVSTYTSNIQIYTPTGTYQSSWQPVVTSAPSCVVPGSSYVVSGNQLNGLTQGAYYGDDQQASTNYPLVQIINNSTGHVFYARTSNHSTMSVAPNAAGSTNFKVAAGTEPGASTLYVIANGIPSAGTDVTVASSCATVQVTPSTPITASGNYGGPFSPTTFPYQLSSTSDPVNFLIGGIPSWLNASFTSGTATTSPMTVTFSLMNVGTLHHGTYNATITFTNTTNGQGNTSRTATLIVNPTKDECKNGGWQTFTSAPGPFRNQGQCVSYFASTQ